MIPTYNELENLPMAVTAVLEALPDSHVLVVDDSSPDGTGALADVMAAREARVHVLHRSVKDGLGGAYLAGFAWALDRGYAFIGEFDADGSHPAAALPLMQDVIRRTDGAALVIGSRWVIGGTVVDWPLARQLLSRGGNTYARVALALPVHDVTAGFRLYRAEALRVMDLGSVRSKGYCFQIDLTVRLLAAGGRITELPIEFRERRYGTSKMSRAVVVEAMALVTVWGIARVLGRPRRWTAARLGSPVVRPWTGSDLTRR
ncbi:dolichol-phosphate mannosyltransferase [Amnibacterium kyonggiense]|uniref:Dolichol-phosphate mannosyltransferase n=1 Tax=Amnibacterium kyonggiense TaxID=595671 RepID=A0A4R7FPM6_9MICO|nr:dolichol-phosphate mannosyltransferase [Amnibacterium kyonggiense]